MKTTYKPLTLREHFRIMQALPRYLDRANTVSESDARELVALFPGLTLDDCSRDLAQANQYGQERRVHADMRGNGKGLFCSAFSLFYGYIYESERCAHCESEEARRNDHQADE